MKEYYYQFNLIWALRDREVSVSLSQLCKIVDSREWSTSSFNQCPFPIYVDKLVHRTWPCLSNQWCRSAFWPREQGSATTLEYHTDTLIAMVWEKWGVEMESPIFNHRWHFGIGVCCPALESMHGPPRNVAVEIGSQLILQKLVHSVKIGFTLNNVVSVGFAIEKGNFSQVATGLILVANTILPRVVIWWCYKTPSTISILVSLNMFNDNFKFWKLIGIIETHIF